MQLDAQGVVFVYNPDVPDHATELELFYDYFAVQSNLTDACCLLLANQQTKIKSNVTFRKSGKYFFTLIYYNDLLVLKIQKWIYIYIMFHINIKKKLSQTGKNVHETYSREK